MSGDGDYGTTCHPWPGAVRHRAKAAENCRTAGHSAMAWDLNFKRHLFSYSAKNEQDNEGHFPEAKACGKLLVFWTKCYLEKISIILNKK